MNQQSQPTTHVDVADDANLQAAAWLVRRADEVWLLQDEQEFQQWLGANATNRQAYAHAQRVWDELGALGNGDVHLDEVADQLPMDISVLPQPRVLRRNFLKGAGVAVFAVGALWAGAGSKIMLDWEADYRTAVGERREVVLPDGSRVHLGGDSAVAIRYDANERYVRLLRGEALFEARPIDKAKSRDSEIRPFVVAAGEGRTKALGTNFILERFEETTRVTGVQHQVAVSLDHAPHDAVVVSPGQRVSYDGKSVSAVQELSEDAGAAWARGLLVFDRMKLIDVVSRLNRYHSDRIVVRGQALAQRQVSGIFSQSDAQTALKAVAQELGVHLLELPGLVVLF